MPSGLDRNLVQQVLSNDSKETNETWAGGVDICTVLIISSHILI